MSLGMMVENFKSSDNNFLIKYLENYKMLSKVDLLYCAAKGIYMDYDEDGSIQFKEYENSYSFNKEIEEKVEEGLYEIKEDIFEGSISNFKDLFKLISDNVSKIIGVEEIDCYNIALVIGSTMNIC